jgi:hypothetical protein
MRFVFLILLAVLAFPSAVLARDYPVCLRVYDNMVDWYDECGYTSIPQCQASASGRSAQCLINPFYSGPTDRPRAHRRYRHS